MYGNNKRKSDRTFTSTISYGDKDSNTLLLGIVIDVITIDHEDFVKNENIPYLDNRNAIIYLPIGQNPSTPKLANLLNKRDYELPLKNEAILVLSSMIGDVVIDTFSLSPNINYDPQVGLLANNESFIKDIKTLDFEKNQLEQLKKATTQELPPFASKIGSKYFLGRNGQYLIFDTQKRLLDDEKSDGDFIKVGFRLSENETETSDDNCIIIAKNEKIQKMFSDRLENKYNITMDDEPMNGIGFQDDEVYLKGNRFVIFYSKKDLLVYAEEVLNIISKKQILIDSEKIQIGENANQKAVRGEDMVKMIDEFFSIIEELPLKLLTPVGTTLGASPDVIAKMTNFRAKYLSTSNPILSKKILIE